MNPTNPINAKDSMQPGDVQITCADISKARRMLDYNPSTLIDDGIEKFIEWFKVHSSTSKAVE